MGASITVISDDETSAERNNPKKYVEAVEVFAEEAFYEGSKETGLLLILNDPGGREAFANYLTVDCGNTEILSVYEELMMIKRLDDSDIAAGAQKFVDEYENCEEDSESSVPNRVLENISSTLNLRYPNSYAKVIQSIDDTLKELIDIMARTYFPMFIGSEQYKNWRTPQSAKLAVETDTNVEKSVIRTSRNSKKKTSGTSFIEPTAVERLFGSGSWLATLLGAAESLPICVTLADASPTNPGFPLLYVNKVFEHVTGYSRDRIRGTNCKFLQSSRSEKRAIAFLSKSLSLAKPVKVKITNFKANGDAFINLLAMKPIFDSHGNYRYVIGIQFDISEPGCTATNCMVVDSLLHLLPNVIPTNESL